MTTFGSYRLVQQLAVGGMAELFLAKYLDEPGDRYVVVKRILPDLLGRPEIVEMFSDEVRISSLLDHPNIVRVLDYGDVDGQAYIALEHVDGVAVRRLERWWGAHALPLDVACWLAAEVCAGLAYAHGRTVTYSSQPLRIVHRDVTPHNILVGKQGQVKLADFGVAKAEMRLTKTNPGQLKGKFGYMSPEQCRGRRVDHRTDIFATGLILYELTTGFEVFDATSPGDIIDQILFQKYTPPERKVPGYPPALAAIVNRALRWDPDERYQDVREMGTALRELLPGGRDRAEQLAALVTQCCQSIGDHLAEAMVIQARRAAQQSAETASTATLIDPDGADDSSTISEVPPLPRAKDKT